MHKISRTIDFLLPSLATGGAEKVMLLLARQFQQAGYRVRFVLRRQVADSFEDLARREFPLFILGASKVRHFPARLQQFYRKEEKPDVIIASLWPLTFLSVLVARYTLPNTKVILVEHGSLAHQVRQQGALKKWFLRRSLALSLRWCHRMVAVSTGLRRELEALSGYQGPKLISISNPIEDREQSEPMARDLPQTLPGSVFLFVGRLKKVKNLPLLLEAFAELLATRSASLLIVGDGTERPQLEAQCAQLGIDERVHFLGFQEDPTPYYRRADILVLSSDSEGFGNVLVEALQQGCTVVSTDCPYGPREILADGTYGYLVPVGNPQALAAGMQKAIDEPIPAGLAQKRGAEFTPAAIFRQYEKAMNDA